MSRLQWTLSVLLFLALLAPAAAASLDQSVASPAAPALTNTPTAPGDEYWATGFNQPGVNETIVALAFSMARYMPGAISLPQAA